MGEAAHDRERLVEELRDEARRIRALGERLERRIAELLRDEPAPALEHEASETDRAAAKAIARKMGLVVRESKR